MIATEGEIVEGRYLVPLTQDEIKSKVDELKLVNKQIEVLSLKANLLINEVQVGRTNKEVKCFKTKNYQTGKSEIFYNGFLIMEVPLTDGDRQIDFTVKTATQNLPDRPSEDSKAQEIAKPEDQELNELPL